MRRFKIGWILVAITSVAIGLAALYANWGREIDAERLSTRALTAQQKSRAVNQPENGAIVEPLAPMLPDFGQAGRVENPQPRKEPLRIKTH
jgi:hypothetical protein